MNWLLISNFSLFIPVLDLTIFFFPMKTIESLGCGLYTGAAYPQVNTVCIIFAPIFFVESRGEC